MKRFECPQCLRVVQSPSGKQGLGLSGTTGHETKTYLVDEVLTMVVTKCLGTNDTVQICFH